MRRFVVAVLSNTHDPVYAHEGVHCVHTCVVVTYSSTAVPLSRVGSELRRDTCRLLGPRVSSACLGPGAASDQRTQMSLETHDKSQ